MVTCDLHNHSCLSPCASLDMSPSLLARLGAARGIGLMALTDHNAALNAPAFAACARREGIGALYGTEACTIEEVHVLCLFADPEAALEFGAWLAPMLPDLPYEADALGDQVVVNERDEVLDMPRNWLGAALSLGFDELCAAASARGALVIPAHIDRPMFGALAQLGFLPEGPYAAVEAMRPLEAGQARGYPVISGSDAHYPEHIGRRPFGLELARGWRGKNGGVNLAAVGEALSGGAVRLPFAP